MPSTPKPPDYSFEEFCIHHHDMSERLHTKDATGDECPSFCFEQNVIDVSDYMKGLYVDERERQYKLGRFVLIMSYVSEHIGDFDQSDFAVYGSEKVGALVSDHLLRAVHQIYTTRDLSAMGRGPDPAEVMALARQLEE